MGPPPTNRQAGIRGAALVCALALGLSACAGGAGGSASSTGPLKVGSVLDLTGPLSIYGVPKSKVAKLAIADINANGGVLGRKLSLVQYDSRSETQKNVQYANQLAIKDKVAVVHGGITSASREAMRPVLSRLKTLYFYNSLYEGGVCDRNEVITGETASQFLEPLIDYAARNLGKKMYIVAADYNYGRISAQWIEKYARQHGATVLGKEFISLDSGDFASTLNTIQQKSPDVIVSVLVGGNHVPFYRGFAAKGLGARMKIISPSFGLGNEQEILSPAEAEGIITSYNYYEELKNPANAAFMKKFAGAYGQAQPYITDLAVSEWNGWHLWAAAVNKAGSLDRDKVLKAIESGQVSIDSPSGKVTIDGPSHHVVEDITLGRVNDRRGFDLIRTFPGRAPIYEKSVCDLIKNPSLNRAFTP
jgi:branched-chain amino acid transport system substrate-binding protein